MTSFEDAMQALGSEFDNMPTKADNRQKFPCGQCAGTGTYQGFRTQQTKSHCFACKGKGYFLTDPRKLQDQAKARAKAKAQATTNFILANKETVLGLAAVASWNNFASQMLVQLGLDVYGEAVDRRIRDLEAGFNFKGGKPLTERQLAACEAMLAKLAARKAAKAAEAKASEVAVDLTAVRSMFDTAVGNGYKRPKYRAEGLAISLAPATGRNAGALYVVREEDDTYLGKIVGTTFQPTREGKTAGDTLLAIAADPRGAAIRYGQRTGTCSCCGRKLTNHTSIDAGIGPVCASKWGL